MRPRRDREFPNSNGYLLWPLFPLRQAGGDRAGGEAGVGAGFEVIPRSVETGTPPEGGVVQDPTIRGREAARATTQERASRPDAWLGEFKQIFTLAPFASEEVGAAGHPHAAIAGHAASIACRPGPLHRPAPQWRVGEFPAAWVKTHPTHQRNL